MCKPRTTSYLLLQVSQPGLTFYGRGPAYVLSWLGMMSADWFGSMLSEMFLQMKLMIFQGCPTE